VLQERLDSALDSDAILDPSDANHVATRAEAENLTNLSRLVQSDAYMNPRHPDHELIKKRVSRYFELEFSGGGDRARRPNPIVIETDKHGLSTQSHLMRPKD
jgi:hypothetical protein